MLCPLCKKDCTHGHVCSTVGPDDPGNAAVAALSNRYEALKGAVLAVYKTAGGEPGDSPEKAVARAIKAAKATALKAIVADVEGRIVAAQKAKVAALEDPADDAVRSYHDGFGDALAAVLVAIEKALKDLEVADG